MRHQPIDPALFIENRARLVKLLAPNSLAAINANDILPTNADGQLPLVPQSDLFYLTGVEQEEVVEALEVGKAYIARSLFGDDSQDGDAEPIDSLWGEEAGYEETENRAVLAAGFRALDEREREVLRLRFFEGLAQSQIAVEVGVSQMHVSRLIRRALEKLESEIEEVP